MFAYAHLPAAISLFAGDPDEAAAFRVAVEPSESTKANPSRSSGEEALVTAARQGDDDAFTELVRIHKTRIFGLATRFARDDHEREDLSQEIFIQAYRKLHLFRGESPFEHWLARIAVRKCYDLLRRTRRERQSHVSLDAAGDLAEDDVANRNAQAREAREVIERALRALPPDDRLVITLLELEDFPVREIADLTGWSEMNVRTRAYRARTALKKILIQQIDPP